MRRRYQRRLTTAMAGGRILSPRAPGSRKRQFMEKPKFYDTWVSPGGVGWDTIMASVPCRVATVRELTMRQQPVAAHELSKASLHPQTSQRDRSSGEHSSRLITQERRLSRRPSLFSILSRSSDRRHAVTPHPHSERADDRAPPRRMQVSVLVAMPKPRPPSSTTDVSTIDSSKLLEQDEIPHVVLGVTQVTCTNKRRHSR